MATRSVKKICVGVILVYHSLLQTLPQKGETNEDSNHRRKQKVICPEDDKTDNREAEADERASMVFFSIPLIDENDNEKSGHHEVDACGIEGENVTAHGTEYGAKLPINIVKEGDKEIEPPFINVFWDDGGAVYAKGLVTHPKDDGQSLFSDIMVLIQHREPIENVASVDKYSSKKGA